MYMDVEMDIPRYDYQTQNFSQNFYEEVKKWCTHTLKIRPDRIQSRSID